MADEDVQAFTDAANQMTEAIEAQSNAAQPMQEAIEQRDAEADLEKYPVI